MPKQYKINACLICMLAVVFYLFWQLCKQAPALAQVATFTEDPYDAIAPIQFAIFLALLTAIRAFRPYQPSGAQDSQQALLVRGAYLVYLAVAVTIGADAVAMLRYPSVWIGKPSGSLLVTLVGVMALLTAFVGWRIYATESKNMKASGPRKWARALGMSLIGISICALYPQNWRQGFPLGGWGTVFILFTIGVGIMIQYTSLWAWSMVICPPKNQPSEDFIDDLALLYTLLKKCTGRLRLLLVPIEKALGSSLFRPIVNRMNPRKGRWYGLALIGIVIGVLLALAETLGNGHLYPPLGLLIVYVGVECFAVLVGYAFFAKFLGLARHDPPEE